MEYFRCLCYCDSTIRFSLFIDALAVILRGGRIVVVGIWIHTAKKRKSIHIRAAAVIPPSLLVEVVSVGVGAAQHGLWRILAGAVIPGSRRVIIRGIWIHAARNYKTGNIWIKPGTVLASAIINIRGSRDVIGGVWIGAAKHDLMRIQAGAIVHRGDLVIVEGR